MPPAVEAAAGLTLVRNSVSVAAAVESVRIVASVAVPVLLGVDSVTPAPVPLGLSEPPPLLSTRKKTLPVKLVDGVADAVVIVLSFHRSSLVGEAATVIEIAATVIAIIAVVAMLVGGCLIVAVAVAAAAAVVVA